MKSSKKDIDDFLAQKKIAIVGVSSRKHKFGNEIFKAFKKKGYQVFAVNPKMDRFNDETCYPALKDLPEPVDGVIIAVAKEKAAAAAQEAVDAGIKRVWLQQGGMSTDAVTLCKKNNVTVIPGECTLLYSNPDGIHKFHRWIWDLLGLMPK
ncbi:MAG: CoA-binding protein [bacterium]|nr:CoA-binding protein [bacterium]